MGGMRGMLMLEGRLMRGSPENTKSPVSYLLASRAGDVFSYMDEMSAQGNFQNIPKTKEKSYDVLSRCAKKLF